MISAVQLEAILWGIGTAIGELPPYYLARAARNEIEHFSDNSCQSKTKRFIARSLQTHGFLTIVICASIPNPLFDLAGLLCGHFGISLYVFLSAVLLGKAVIKVHI